MTIYDTSTLIVEKIEQFFIIHGREHRLVIGQVIFPKELFILKI